MHIYNDLCNERNKESRATLSWAPDSNTFSLGSGTQAKLHRISSERWDYIELIIFKHAR